MQTEIQNEQKLCFRCENRALFLEKGWKPRCECGDVNLAVYTCYCYKPMKPVVTETDPNDNRPAKGPWMIAARESGSRIITEDDAVQVVELTTDNKLLAYWLPKSVLIELDKARNKKGAIRATTKPKKKRRTK